MRTISYLNNNARNHDSHAYVYNTARTYFLSFLFFSGVIHFIHLTTVHFAVLAEHSLTHTQIIMVQRHILW